MQVALMPSGFVCYCGNAMTIEYLAPSPQGREHTVFLWCLNRGCKHYNKRGKLSLPIVVLEEVPNAPPEQELLVNQRRIEDRARKT